MKEDKNIQAPRSIIGNAKLFERKTSVAKETATKLTFKKKSRY